MLTRIDPVADPPTVPTNDSPLSVTQIHPDLNPNNPVFHSLHNPDGTQVAPLHPGLFSRRGRYLTCTQGHKCGIPRCVWDRGTRKHPGAGFAIPCFGDADDHFFFRVRCPPKKAPPGGLCKEESCPRVILDSFLIQEFGISRHMPTVFDSTLPPPP